MSKFKDVPNIGSVLEKKLVEAGVETPQKLIEIGSKEAFLKLKAIDDDVCFNTLCALEGAIRGVRWFYLDPITKKSLKDFFDENK